MTAARHMSYADLIATRPEREAALIKRYTEIAHKRLDREEQVQLSAELGDQISILVPEAHEHYGLDYQHKVYADPLSVDPDEESTGKLKVHPLCAIVNDIGERYGADVYYLGYEGILTTWLPFSYDLSHSDDSVKLIRPDDFTCIPSDNLMYIIDALEALIQNPET